MDKENSKFRLFRYVQQLATAAGLFLCIFTMLGFAGEMGWIFDIFSHFRFQYLVCLLICIAVTANLKQRIVFIWIFFAVLNMVPMIQFFEPAPKPADGAQRLKLLTMNLEAINNKTFEPAVRCAKEFDPDIIALQEVNHDFGEYLKLHLPEYKYSKILTGELCEGVGIMSKMPLEKISALQFGNNFPLVCATAKTQIGDIEVVAAHPVPPIDFNYWDRETVFFDGLKEFCKVQKGSVIVMGDLNATAYGYQLSHFKDLSGMQDSSRGFGLQFTWPAQVPPLWINIDQCLFTKDLTAVARKVGPETGSDHRPLYIEVTKR